MWRNWSLPTLLVGMPPRVDAAEINLATPQKAKHRVPT